MKQKKEHKENLPIRNTYSNNDQPSSQYQDDYIEEDTDADESAGPTIDIFHHEIPESDVSEILTEERLLEESQVFKDESQGN